MADKLVTIAQYADSIEASLAQQLLADFGIKAVLAGQHAADVYTLPAIAATELQVLRKPGGASTANPGIRWKTGAVIGCLPRKS